MLTEARTTLVAAVVAAISSSCVAWQTAEQAEVAEQAKFRRSQVDVLATDLFDSAVSLERSLEVSAFVPWLARNSESEIVGADALAVAEIETSIRVLKEMNAVPEALRTSADQVTRDLSSSFRRLVSARNEYRNAVSSGRITALGEALPAGKSAEDNYLSARDAFREILKDARSIVIGVYAAAVKNAA